MTRPPMGANRRFFLSLLGIFVVVHTLWIKSNYDNLGVFVKDNEKYEAAPEPVKEKDSTNVSRLPAMEKASKNVILMPDRIANDLSSPARSNHKSSRRKVHKMIKKKVHKKNVKKKRDVLRLVAAGSKDTPVSKKASKPVISNVELMPADIAIDIEAIIDKWNLTSSNAAALLQQQAQRSLSDYDENRDFIYLHHFPKTAGTTISIIIDRLFKSSVLPGSGRVTNFQFPKARDVLSETSGKERLRYKVSYSHSPIRPTVGPEQTKVAKYLRSTIPPQKKLRLMTVVREPVTHRASYHAMITCGLNLMVRQHNRQRKRQGLEAQCGFELNLTDVVDSFIGEKKRLCEKGEITGKKYCQGNFTMCYSARNFLSSPSYTNNMYGPIMGQFYNDTYAEPPISIPIDEGMVSKVEDYTLRDLGGLPFQNKWESDEADFLWFGVTERMTESLCLLYYTLRISEFPDEVPNAHFNTCRPLSWWSEEDKATARKRAVWDSVVWRAGNAILDVRMERMKSEIRASLRQGIKLEDIPYVAPGCFE